MKSNEMLNQIKTLLNIEIKLEEMKLENGTVITSDSFEDGKEVFIVTDDEKVALPVGEYILEDGRLLVVSEEGIIAEIKEVSDEVPAEEAPAETADLEVEDYEEKEKVVDLEALEKRIQNLEDIISSIKENKESKMEDVEEQDLEANSGTLKTRTVKEEFSEDLSQASADPIKHNPEKESVPKPNKVEFGKSKMGQTALERVLNRLNQNK
tara:strand:- start:288 stop:917 length:630 start_codon:yes stop_codon:yes gene_type:complete